MCFFFQENREQHCRSGRNRKNIYNYLALYTPTHRKFIVIEIIASNIDSFSNREDIINAGDS
jgi:hypothetical protein